jgi:hypothetical protein
LLARASVAVAGETEALKTTGCVGEA